VKLQNVVFTVNIRLKCTRPGPRDNTPVIDVRLEVMAA